MQKNEQSYKWIKRHISYYVACGVITLSIPALVNASETDLKEAEKSPTAAEAEFDSAFLIGDAKR